MAVAQNGEGSANNAQGLARAVRKVWDFGWMGCLLFYSLFQWSG